MSSLYSIEKLNYFYNWNQQEVHILRNLDLKLDKSSFTCIVGPSGTGKTTLLNLMGLLDEHKGGTLTFLGTDISQLAEEEKEQVRLKDIGFVFQSYYLIPTLTVLENTTYFLDLLGYTQQQANQRAASVLELLGLKDHLTKYPAQLSGGQKQRVAIARALAKKPKVILADEPTANLDAQTAELTIKAFQDLQKNEETSFVFSTHDSHLMSYAAQIYKMQDGHLEQVVN